jgi:hypothetical protein
MIRSARNLGVVANFWEWYQRRQQQECNPLAGYALDKCEEAFAHSEWDRFGYWFTIYCRKRPRSPSANATHNRHSG